MTVRAGISELASEDLRKPKKVAMSSKEDIGPTALGVFNGNTEGMVDRPTITGRSSPRHCAVRRRSLPNAIPVWVAPLACQDVMLAMTKIQL